MKHLGTLLIALELVVASIACDAQPLDEHEPRPCVELTVEAAPEMRHGIEAAWAQTTHWSQPVRYVDAGGELVMRWAEPGELPPTRFAYYAAGELVLATVLAYHGPSLDAYIAHELGHHLGLDHDDDGAVMAPTPTGSRYSLDERAMMAAMNQPCSPMETTP